MVNSHDFNRTISFQQPYREGLGGGITGDVVETLLDMWVFLQPSAGCCVEQQIKDDPSLTLNCFKQSKFGHAIKKLTPKYNLLDVEPFKFQ